MTTARRSGAHEKPRTRPASRAAAPIPSSRSSGSPGSSGSSAATIARSAERLLAKSLAAKSPSARARWAERALSSGEALDPSTHAMLLRQVSLAHYEHGRFERAREVAVEALALDVLPDVLLQDAARAAIAAGDIGGAIDHLRDAVRRGPPSRRAFHLWTLGSVLFLERRYAEAIDALAQATHAADPTDASDASDASASRRARPLYAAHLALAQIASGETVAGLSAIMTDLAAAPCGRGYGRFVLGHLAYAAGAWPSARRLLEAFVRRTERGRPALSLSLAGELAMARATLVKMTAS